MDAHAVKEVMQEYKGKRYSFPIGVLAGNVETDENHLFMSRQEKNEIQSIKQAFQAGCDTIVAGCTTYGATPASNSPKDIVAAIKKIYNDRYAAGREQGRKDVTANPGEYGINIIKYGDSIAAESFDDFVVYGINGDYGAVKSKTYNIPIKSNRTLYGITMINKVIARGTYTARGSVECSYKLKTAEEVLLASGSKYWNINVDEDNNAEGRDDYIGAVDIDIFEHPFNTSASYLVLELSVTTYCSLGNKGTIHIEGDYTGIRAKYK